MATLVITNDWLQTAGHMAHGLIYAQGYLWIGCETEPGTLIRMDPANPSAFSTVTFPSDNKHFWILDVIYIPSKGKIYALFGKFGTDAFHETTVAEIDPVTLAWTDVIEDTAYNAEQGSITADATHLYLVSHSTGFIYRYNLSDWSAAGSLNLDLGAPHCCRYDSVTNKIYVTSAGVSSPDLNLVVRVDPVTFTVEQGAGWAIDVFTDDLAMDAEYLWCGSESSGNVTRIKKSDLSHTLVPLPVGTSVYSVYNDGKWIWVAFKGGPPGQFVRIDPSDLSYILFQLPDPSQISPNEIWGDVETEGSLGTTLFFTGYTSPGWVSSYTPGGVVAKVIPGPPAPGPRAPRSCAPGSPGRRAARCPRSPRCSEQQREPDAFSQVPDQPGFGRAGPVAMDTLCTEHPDGQFLDCLVQFGLQVDAAGRDHRKHACRPHRPGNDQPV
jgi:hypothetical protein